MNEQFTALGNIERIHPAAGMDMPPAAGEETLREAQGDRILGSGQPIGKREIERAADILQKYKQGKTNLERRIIENERWYKLRHWEVIRGGNARPDDPEPASAWLFNSLSNKHADAMDNYPEPNILPREPGDEPDANSLSSIIPVIVERNEFEETYSDAWWYKLKTGTAAYGVFWDPELENGLGDIKISKLDLLNVFWQPGITDIQQSPNLFMVQLVDDEALKAQYPWLEGSHSAAIDVSQYVYDDHVDTSEKSVVVDWYYKRKSPDGKTLLHYAKFVGSELLFSSENDPAYAETGWYGHGRYPVVFDVLFPEEGTPVGFGYLDIMKQPQLYIDKLNQIIMRNALMSGKKRWFIKDTGGVNEAEFADWSKDFVHVSGQLGEDHLREISVSPVSGYVVNHLQMKIDELKETSGNRDFSQGGTSGGVTAAAAIAALQEAGNKMSRDMIKGSYRVYTKLIYLCIELIRQFYDEARAFRIEGARGMMEFVRYSNQRIREQEILPSYPGGMPAYRVPVFDIRVKPQKSNPFSRAAQNEIAKELYGMGFFNPQLADQALAALELMDFEGKQAVVERIGRSVNAQRQMAQMQQQMAGMAQALEMGQAPGGEPVPEEGAGASRGGGMSRAASAAAENASTPYGERLAQRAVPDMNRQAGIRL